METSGANGSDILLSSAESLQLDVPIGAVTSNVFLIANGDIGQQSGANIVANQLGIRQEATSLQSNADLDGNSRFDVLLADNNNVNSLAVFNAFNTGVVVFNEVNDLVIGEINERTFCNGTVFHQTTGLSTTFSGPAIQGGGDIVDGDLLIQTGGSLQVDSQIVSGSGNSDVRLVANGLIQQVSTTLLLANELGVRQESTVSGNIVLAGFNNVDIIAVGNSAEGGFIAFRNIDNLVVDEVSSQSISGIEFANTVGLESTFSGARLTGSADNNLGDIVINVGGFLRLEQSVDAANADVFLTSGGDISQSTGTPIFSNELGAIQENAIFDSDGDFDTDSSFVIDLLAQNQIDVFGSTNALFAGNIQFKNSTGFSIDEIPSQNPGVSFSGTDGIESNDGDVFLISAGYLNLESSLQSEAGTVRLLAAGDIHQTSNSIINAGQLGARQEGTTLASNGDIDINNRFDVILDGFNDVDELAIENRFETGVVAFSDLSGLTIGEVSAVLAQGNLFTDTSGIVSTFAGPGITGGGDSVHGDIVIEAGGFVQINHTIDSGAADIRISSSGDVLQSTNGILVANEFGVVQSENNVNMNSDQDGNNSLDVHLTWQNTVDLFAAENSFAGGDVIFNNVQGLVVDAVSSLAIDDSSFVGVEGIATLSGDVFLNSNGFLSLEETIDAGAAVVRLLANGDVIQSANGVINAGSLGVRQEGMDANSETDVDSNGRLDIILDDGNEAEIFGAVNAFDNGRIVFRNIPGLTIGEVSSLVFSDIAFSQTIGIEGQADILIQSAGFLNITQNVSASSGNSDIRLIALGDVVQGIDATIAANHLGIRQLGEQVVAAGDLDSNGDYDIHLCAPNLVSVFAATNSIGDVYFANNQDLVVGAVTSQLIGSIGFAFTTGVVAGEDAGIQVQSGNLQISSSITVTNSTLLQSAGFLSIDAETYANEVRLVAEGDIVQSTSGAIVTSLLGVRQQGLNATPATDVDSNGSLDVILDDANDIATHAASNEFSNGIIAFNNIGDLTIGNVSEFAFGNKFFADTTGVNGRGDVLLQTDGPLEITNSIIADNGNADVRLITSGNVFQDANAIIVADGLGVRQTSNGDVVLNSVNLVNTFSAFNPNGEVHFTNGQDLLIGTVGEQTIGNISFPTTSGTFGTEVVIQVTEGDLAVEDVITVVDGDVLLLQSGGTIQIDSTLTSPEIRLVANGDIFQTANGVITADLLGVRQDGVVLTDAGDLDGNNQFDIILDGENQVDTVAISNVFDGGVIAFNNEIGFTVDTVSEFAFGSLAFAATTGVVSRGDIFLQSGGYLNLAEATSADEGTADVRLVAIGDIVQSGTGVISAGSLGVRQEGLVASPESDVYGNDQLDIILDDGNQVEIFAALNAFDNGRIALRNAGGLTVGSVEGQSLDNIVFEQTIGLQGQGAILIQSAGFLNINQTVSADEGSGDVRLIATGDVVQQSGAIIIANRLGVRQQGATVIASEDLDSSGTYDIHLCAPNLVNAFAASNPSGSVYFANNQDLEVGTVTSQQIGSIGFAFTTGVVAGEDAGIQVQSGNLQNSSSITVANSTLLQSAGFISIDAETNANEVRLVAEGDIVQSTSGAIITSLLGIRQQGLNATPASDVDSNGSLDVILDDANDIATLAASNEFSDGVIAFNNIGDLTIGSISEFAFGNKFFAQTTGVTGKGDILLQTGGSLGIANSIIADNGNANVRLIGNGNVTQDPNAIIVAYELGVRQTGSGDIVLSSNNLVNTFAAFNANGEVLFTNGQDLLIGTVGEQTIGNISFPTTLGTFGTEVVIQVTEGDLAVEDVITVVDGDVLLLQSGGTIQIDSTLTSPEIRLVANGDIFQTANGVITADLLGVRQDGVVLTDAGDLDGNDQFDIILDDENQVDTVAISNVFDGGLIAFNNEIGFTVDTVSEFAFDSLAFAETTGVVSRGDIFLQSGGYLYLAEVTSADTGEADVRLIAIGDVLQESNGIITANELGIRIQAGSFVAENDLDNSGFLDIVLDSLNVVNVFGALNLNHDVSFTNDQTLSIGSVDDQRVGNLDFQSTTGITAENDIGIENLNGILDVSGSVSASANLLLRSAGSISANASVMADASMLVGNGDIVQSSMGTFTSRLLAIRQEGTVANSLSDLDNNNRFEVILDDANDIDVLAAFNSFDGGVVALNDIDDLTIGSANGFPFANKTFAATTGISTELADVLFQVGGFLNIESPVDSGADIRFVANGDVVQTAQGILIANELGIRQASDIVSSANDLDDNDRHDIVLEAANQTHVFAAFNSIGDVFFSNQQDLVVDNIDGQTIGNIEFELTGNTAGNNVKIQVLAGNLDVSSDVTAEGESLQLDSSGSVTLNQQVSSDNVRLISSGDIVQADDGAIIASVLGIRQTADLVSSTADLDSNGRFDVVLDALNDVDVLAVNNSSNSGILVFNDADDLTIGSAAQVTLGDSTFTAATGLVTSYEAPGGLSSADSVEGDILVQTNGFLRIENSILAGNGINRVGGNSDLRLIANGEITQAATGTINAQEFGIRQNNLSGVFNILLDQSNDVAVFSGQNVSDGGFIVFNDFDSVSSANTGLIIGSISHQAIGDVAFDQVDGLSTVFSGSEVTGSDDSDLGDVLVVSNGFLDVNAPINAGAGASDLRIIANGDIVQNDNAPVFANELGILQAANALDSADDSNGDSKHSVEFGGGDGALFVNDVDTLSILNQENEGDILFRDVDDLVIERISSQSLGSIIFRGFNGVVSDDFSTGDNSQDGDGDILLEAMASLSDGQDIIVATGGNALLRGDAQILLSDQLGDQLQIGGNVLFRSADIDVGQDGDIVGSSNNVRFGSITVNDLGFAVSTADITEDDSTVLTSQTILGSIDNQVSLLVLTSGGSITNQAETVMRLDRVQFNATTGSIFIGNQAEDVLNGLGGTEIELGLNAINASIDSEGSIEINGMVPVIENNANDASLIDNFGTNVGESLFIRSAGHIEQVVGVLEATQVGLNASEHVFLELVGASNEMVAIYAGEARLDSDLPNHQSLLEQLASIEGSDVHSDLVQSVSIRHQGDLVVGAVSNPDENGFLTTATGVTSNAENSGSIFLTGEDSLTISQDVSANASNSLPQVSVFVESENAENNNGSQISFANGATINVNGNRNGESNVGIVNSGRTVAFFGIDTDNNGAIDTFFFDSNQNGFMDAGERVFDTTTIISLGVSGTAPQFFEAVYGNPGESGYRFAFVFDSERRFNSIVAPEVPNLYTTNEFAESERFDVSFLEQLAPFAPFTVPGSDLEFQTALIEQMSNLNGRFNFNTIFEKVDPWTRDAITARTDNPLVFTVIEVRNDQDINLFVGQDADNGLNSVSQTLEARIENVGLRPTAPSFTFVENDIPEIVFPRFIAGQIPIIIEAESPELKVFEKPGTLSWIAVRIDDPEDIEDVDGELILKKPLVDYEPLSPNESPKQLEGVSRNQYEEIISQIEADPDAEVGLWYKIFLEQGNESKKEDELLFYYYKTGKEQEQRIEPESDFRSDSSTDALDQPELEQINPAEFDQSSDGTEQPSGPVLIDPANSDDVVSEVQQQEDIKERRSFANVSNGLLVAALVVNSRQKSESHDLQCHQSNAPQFIKLNSLKRQLTDLIESSGG